MFQLIKTNNNDYRIEGLTDIQVLRIYQALKSANNKSHCLELETMTQCLKIDMYIINKQESKKDLIQ